MSLVIKTMWHVSPTLIVSCLAVKVISRPLNLNSRRRTNLVGSNSRMSSGESSGEESMCADCGMSPVAEYSQQGALCEDCEYRSEQEEKDDRAHAAALNLGGNFKACRVAGDHRKACSSCGTTNFEEDGWYFTEGWNLGGQKFCLECAEQAGAEEVKGTVKVGLVDDSSEDEEDASSSTDDSGRSLKRPRLAKSPTGHRKTGRVSGGGAGGAGGASAASGWAPGMCARFVVVAEVCGDMVRDAPKSWVGEFPARDAADVLDSMATRAGSSGSPLEMKPRNAAERSTIQGLLHVGRDWESDDEFTETHGLLSKPTSKWDDFRVLPFPGEYTGGSSFGGSLGSAVSQPNSCKPAPPLLAVAPPHPKPPKARIPHASAVTYQANGPDGLAHFWRGTSVKGDHIKPCDTCSYRFAVLGELYFNEVDGGGEYVGGKLCYLCVKKLPGATQTRYRTA